MATTRIPRNLGLDLVRATEAAAISAGRWMGLGQGEGADHAASKAMINVLDGFNMDGRIVYGEVHRATTYSGQPIGSGDGPAVDIVADPIDGRRLLSMGHPGAISAIAVAPRDAFWSPAPAEYMEKIIVDHEVADVLVAECLDAPAAWTLALVARAKGKEVGDLVVYILDRPRHKDLLAEVRTAGARAMLRSEGDLLGALMAAVPESGVDILMGAGGVLEGLISACAVKALGGAMLGRLAPQSQAEVDAVRAARLDISRVVTCEDLVTGWQIYFAATGIVDNPLLAGIHYMRGRARSHSMILRGETGTRRMIRAEHMLVD